MVGVLPREQPWDYQADRLGILVDVEGGQTQICYRLWVAQTKRCGTRGGGLVAQRAVESDFWQVQAKKLTKNERYLFLYLRTAPGAHLAGIYYCPILYMSHETSLTHKETSSALVGLEKKGMVYFDGATETVWVVGMLAIASKGAKVIAAVEKQLKSLNGSYLIQQFLEHYIALGIAYEYPIDTVSSVESNEKKGIDTLTDTETETNPETETETETTGLELVLCEAVPEVVPDYELVVQYLNTQAQRSLTPDAHRKVIERQLRDHTLEDLRLVVDHKVSEWAGGDMAKYLRPQTLFQPSKFGGYLDEAREWDLIGRPRGAPGKRPVGPATPLPNDQYPSGEIKL